MSLVLNEEQLMLRDSAQDFLQSQAPVGHLRKLRDDQNNEGFSRSLWQEIRSRVFDQAGEAESGAFEAGQPHRLR